ncbi:hypothetical protein K435DRAFT_30980 [Dendrothele bispora CBS 962.96]|uniref:Uncharacterized protein n=1 Tax=Dendrothele bispora (strain CBS 962.96) TaxID=1314807 RepID=A0A4S8KU38_DENBC|nr:hypothetical protein K435DRAFT_30980 [Dendrothele bispora CBS 962.96]
MDNWDVSGRVFHFVFPVVILTLFRFLVSRIQNLTLQAHGHPMNSVGKPPALALLPTWQAQPQAQHAHYEVAADPPTPPDLQISSLPLLARSPSFGCCS